jgi:hypothetical protein
MKKFSIACMAIAASTFSVSAFSATGEYWEVTSKMEMQGMPFAMPATTRKVCVAKGEERDPRKSAPNKDCEMSDVKFTGDKTSWKVRCNHNGDITEGTGEFTYGSDNYQGAMHMKSTSHGRTMDMNMALSGKRVGGSCEPGAEAKAMQSQIQKQACDTTGYTAAEWIGSANRFLHDSTLCPGKKEELCSAVSKDAPRNTDVYQTLVQSDKFNGGLIASSCKLNMAAITHSVCGKVNDSNVESMAQYCPAEAKKIMEARRSQGQSYTSDRSYTASGAGSQAGSGSASASDSASASPTNKLLDSAKKLKGMFGF